MKRLLLVLFLAFAPVAVYAQDNPPPVVVSDGTTTTITSEDQVTSVTAPDAQTVVVPYGNWIDALLENLLGIVTSAVAVVFAWLARKLPKAAVDLLRTFQAEQLLARAAEYGINATRGAVKGKELDIHVGNEAIARAAQYAVTNGPGWLIDWLGGPEAIRDKIIARIPLDASVDRSDL